MLDPPPCFTKLQLTLLLPFSSAQAAKRVQRREAASVAQRGVVKCSRSSTSGPPRKNRRQGLCEGSP